MSSAWVSVPSSSSSSTIFRKAGYPELSRRALDAFMTRYLGRVLELADGMRE
ncbi:hypothetical protein [Rhodococcus koreensis]|uniref:Uncharacterized protein n=1 Tax=Rhodococcus koreensis TaxID=99653 RepID=A0A1H4IHK1_9NOCA|nr:hypothetical protein [Rhodococcus koreensis]SEB33604.1 hypothetical protein SAMN04490239_0770 [Rhodococcus koreensis]